MYKIFILRTNYLEFSKISTIHSIYTILIKKLEGGVRYVES